MSEIKIITANTAAAIAAKLSKVQVVSAYPITPQTPVTEELAAMVESGELNAQYLTVESEHSALASVVSAAQIGARVFTATSANGLLYMHEMLHWAAGSRLPIVMACVNRGVGAPWTILNDQQDSISQRDTGWIQLYCRNSQEVLDTIIQAYRIAEQVLTPIMVCYDGFILSHTTTPVSVPEQSEVDKFLPAYSGAASVLGRGPMNVNPLILSEPRTDPQGVLRPGYMDLRHKLQNDLRSALNVIETTDNEFFESLGRAWGGLSWSYKLDDAEHAIVSMGSLASECTVAVDLLRKQGFRVGVFGLRVYRPFPAEHCARLLEGMETITVFEKDISYGYAGALAMDLKAALYESTKRPQFSSYVAGLGGRDIRPEQIADSAVKAITKGSVQEWIDIKW